LGGLAERGIFSGNPMADSPAREGDGTHGEPGGATTCATRWHGGQHQQPYSVLAWRQIPPGLALV